MLRRSATKYAVVAMVLVLLVFLVYRKSDQPKWHSARITLATDKECLKRLQSILVLSLGAYERPSPFFIKDIQISNPREFIKTLSAPLSISCNIDTLPQPLKEASVQYQNHCENALTPDHHTNQSAKPIFACFKAFLYVRYVLAENHVDQKSIPKIKDPNILESRLFPAVFNEPRRNYEDIALLAERLSTLYGKEKKKEKQTLALTYAAQARYLAWRDSIGSTNEPAKSKAFDRSISNLKRLAPEEPTIAELQLSKIRESQTSKALYDAALTYQKAHPTSSTGSYHIAWAYYLMQQREPAIWHLGYITMQNPADTRANYTLARMQHPELQPEGEVFLDLSRQFGGIHFSVGGTRQ